MPIERKVAALDGLVRVSEIDSVAGCDFDVAPNPEAQEHGRRSPTYSACGCIGGRPFPNARK
jgi:hypothetical protein